APPPHEPFPRPLAGEVALGAHLAQGDAPAVQRDIDAYQQLADRVRVPVFRFLAASIRASVAASPREVEESERLSREALELGRGTVPYAPLLVAGQALWRRQLRGDRSAYADVARTLNVGGRPGGGGW